MAKLKKVNVDQAAVNRLRFEKTVMAQVENIAYRVHHALMLVSPYRTGHYVRSIFIRVEYGAQPKVVIGANDFKAWWIEYGAYGRTPPFRARAPLRKALTMVGLRWVGPKMGQR